MPAKKSNTERMIKTSIDLTADHYHFLKMKALERKMRGESPSFVTILRELIQEHKSGRIKGLSVAAPDKKEQMIKTSI